VPDKQDKELEKPPFFTGKYAVTSRILTKLQHLLHKAFRKKQASIFREGFSQLNRGTIPRA
jgi:hypothetical protein